MLTSYLVDGFADVGSMVGAQLLGAGDHLAFGRLTKRLSGLGLASGVVAAAGCAVGRDALIAVLLGDGGSSSSSSSSEDAHANAVALLQQLWPYFCACQVSNAVVFTYDGLLIAAEQFAFARDVLLGGTLGLFLPALLAGFFGTRTLAAVWLAKALLNLWRAAASVARVAWWLPRHWRRQESLEGGGAGGELGKGEECPHVLENPLSEPLISGLRGAP